MRLSRSTRARLLFHRLGREAREVLAEVAIAGLGVLGHGSLQEAATKPPQDTKSMSSSSHASRMPLVSGPRVQSAGQEMYSPDNGH